MEPIKFKTKHGYMVIGGRFQDTIRTPSTQEEIDIAPIEVDQELIDRAEREFEAALQKHQEDWNL